MRRAPHANCGSKAETQFRRRDLQSLTDRRGVPHQPRTIVQKGLVGAGLAVGKNPSAIGHGEMLNMHRAQQSEGVIAGDIPFHLHASVRVRSRLLRTTLVARLGQWFPSNKDYP